MALVKYGFGINDISGKVGGSVFSRTGAGSVLKTKGRQTHKESGAVTIIRSNMSTAQYAWSILTVEARAMWNAFSGLVPVSQQRNPGLFLSGRQLFLQFHQYKSLYNIPFSTDPDLSVVNIEPVVYDLVLASPNLFLTFDRALNPTNEFVCFATTGIVRETLNNPGNRFKFLIITTPAGTDIDIASEYVEKFGVLPDIDQTIFYKAFVYSVISPVRTTQVINRITFT